MRLEVSQPEARSGLQVFDEFAQLALSNLPAFAHLDFKQAAAFVSLIDKSGTTYDKYARLHKMVTKCRN